MGNTALFSKEKFLSTRLRDGEARRDRIKGEREDKMKIVLALVNKVNPAWILIRNFNSSLDFPHSFSFWNAKEHGTGLGLTWSENWDWIIIHVCNLTILYPCVSFLRPNSICEMTKWLASENENYYLLILSIFWSSMYVHHSIMINAVIKNLRENGCISILKGLISSSLHCTL